MDIIDPRSHITCPDWEQSKQVGTHAHYVHEPIDGENLERAKWANQPCKVWPHHFTNGLIVLVLTGAIFAALWAWNAAQGVPV